MKQLIRRLLPKNRFARSVSVLVGGTAFGQALLVLVSPLLTRLYSPEDFGLLAVYAGLLGSFTVIASLRYELAIPLPDDDRDAASVAILSLIVVLGITLLAITILWTWGQPITELLNTPALRPYLWLLPLGLLLGGLYQVLNYWAIRTKQFSVIARTRISQSTSQVAVQLGGAFMGPLALLLSHVAGQAAGNSTLALLAARRHAELFGAVRWTHIKAAAIRWRRFPLFDTWSGLGNVAGLQLPPILFAALFTPAAAGIYMLAHRVLQTPMSLLGHAIAQVFFSQSAEAKREGRLAPLVAGIHKQLAYFAMPPALLLILSGPELFALVFGNEWRQSGQFAQWMAPWLYLVFITSPLSQLFSVLEKQVQGMAFQLTLLIVRVGALFLGAAKGDLLFTVALYSIGSALCWLGFLWWIVRASGNAYTSLVMPTLGALALGVLLVSPMVLYQISGSGLTLWLVALTLSVVFILTRHAWALKNVW